MRCGPIRFLIGAAATAALAGLGYVLTGGYPQAPAVPAAPPPPDVATAPAVAPAAETPATAEQITSCQTTVDGVIKGKTIEFDSSAATIKPESQPLIDALATALAPCAGTLVEVQGHTDLTGDDAANMKLSQDRAAAVVAALTARNVPAARLSAKGYGETRPLRPGRSPAALAANRRIEFAVGAAGAAPAAATPAASTPAAPAQ